MPRIYFDTNVFSNLKTDKEEPFIEINRLFKTYKNILSFYFSVAHIRDKKKDLTNYKFEDYEFMEKIVGDNYLAYHLLEKRTSFYLATPLMVYNDSKDDFDVLTDFFEPKVDDEASILFHKKFIKNLFSTIPFNVNRTSHNSLSENQKKLMGELLPLDKANPTLFDLMQNIPLFTRKIFADSSLYKQLRNLIDKGVNNGAIDLSDNVDFNLALKETSVQKTFLEFITDNMHYKDKSQIPFYEFYSCCYNMLDVFGISKDKITQKNTLDNSFNDGLHSNFAQYCDYFITDDSKTRIKSKALYKLFNIETQVISVNEFKTILVEILADAEDSLSYFINKLTYDLQTAGKQELMVNNEKTIFKLDRNHMYLDFFDTVLEVSSDDCIEIIIFKGEANALSEPSYYEQSLIIKKL